MAPLAIINLLFWSLAMMPDKPTEHHSPPYTYHHDDAKGIDFPIPDVDDLMFYIQRDPNANTVCYTLNRHADGSIDLRKPLHIFWIIYTDNERRQELTYIQRLFAYGIKVDNATQDEVAFRSVAYDKLPLFLRKEKGKYQVHATIGKQACVLKRIYVRIEGSNMFRPNVLYVQLEGVNAKGEAVSQQIVP